MIYSAKASQGRNRKTTDQVLYKSWQTTWHEKKQIESAGILPALSNPW